MRIKEQLILRIPKNEEISYEENDFNLGLLADSIDDKREFIIEANPLSEGEDVAFRKENNATNTDVIIDGVLELFRPNNGGQIYNVIDESFPSWPSSPSGTLWNTAFTDPINNGFSDLTNLKDRNYQEFVTALDNAVGSNILGAEMICYVPSEERYFKFLFDFWQGGGSGGGFGYTRTEVFLANDEVNITVEKSGINVKSDLDNYENNSNEKTLMPKRYIDNEISSLKTYQLTNIEGGVNTYDAVFYVDRDNGDNSTGEVNNPDRPYSTVNQGWFQAYLYQLSTGLRVYVHVRAGNYPERLITLRDKVDLYFEEFAIMYGNYSYVGGIISGLGQTTSAKFDILGKGSFINTTVGTNVNGSGITLANGIHEFNVQAKEISSIAFLADFSFVPINHIFEVEKMYGEIVHNKRSSLPTSVIEGKITFKNTTFPKGFIMGRNWGGIDYEFNQCKAIIDVSTEYTIIDKDSNNFITVPNIDSYDTTVLTNQQVLDGVGFSSSQYKTRRLAAIDLRPGSDFGGTTTFLEDKYVFNNCEFIIRKENCFGVIHYQRANVTGGDGKLIINGGKIIDETIGNNGVALSVGVSTGLTSFRKFGESLEEITTPVKHLDKTSFVPLRNIYDVNNNYVELDETLIKSGLSNGSFGIVNTSYPYKKLELLIDVAANGTTVYVKSSSSSNNTRGGTLDINGFLPISVFTDSQGRFQLSSSDVANTNIKLLSLT